MRCVLVVHCVALLSACAPSATAPRAASTEAEEADEEPTPDEETEVVGDRRCLPVVAAECGCVYSCGLGTRDGDAWSVRHEHWGNAPLRARIDRWCVDGQCTDAFFGEIVCSGICARRPADERCVLDASGCHSEADRGDAVRRPSLRQQVNDGAARAAPSVRALAEADARIRQLDGCLEGEGGSHQGAPRGALALPKTMEDDGPPRPKPRGPIGAREVRPSSTRRRPRARRRLPPPRCSRP